MMSHGTPLRPAWKSSRRTVLAGAGGLAVAAASRGWINGANLPVDGGLEALINAEVLGF